MGKSFERLGLSGSLLAGVGLATFCLVGAAQAALPVDPTGVWLVQDGDARIRIEHCQKPHEKICGYLVWSKDGGAGNDEKNPDASRRSRPILGMQILLGLAASDDQYVGEIYNAENGKTYDAKVRRESDDKLILKGCVLRYLCQSQTWTKVDDVADGQLTGAVGAPNGPKANTEYAQATTTPAAARKTEHGAKPKH